MSRVQQMPQMIKSVLGVLFWTACWLWNYIEQEEIFSAFKLIRSCKQEKILNSIFMYK